MGQNGSEKIGSLPLWLEEVPGQAHSGEGGPAGSATGRILDIGEYWFSCMREMRSLFENRNAVFWASLRYCYRHRRVLVWIGYES